MNESGQQHTDSERGDLPEDWVEAVLAEAPSVVAQALFSPAADPLSDDERRAFLSAGRMGFRLAKMRKRQQEMGFTPLPIHTLLSRGESDSSVREVMDWAGLPKLPEDEKDVSFGGLWARLARLLGLKLEQALIALRLTYVELFEPAQLALLYSRRRVMDPSNGGRGGGYTSVAERIPAWPSERQSRLFAAAAEVSRAYEQECIRESFPPG